MIDFGLLLSMVAAIGIPSLLQHWWPLEPAARSAGPAAGESGSTPAVFAGSFADVVAIPALIGLIVGRLVAVALDAPGQFGRFGDLLIIRSGVEFWPGAVVATVIVGFEIHRRGHSVVGGLAALAPLALVGYAAYEAGCLVRDGCFGPGSPIGLRPPGVFTTMFPTGVAVAVAVVALAVALRRAAEAGWAPSAVVVAAVGGVAGVRSVASIWLPHVGDGLTRPHQTSIVVTVVAATGLAVLVWRGALSQQARSAASETS